jgi:precorrin isomerase
MTVHPIEAESYRVMADRVDLSCWPPGPRTVVERVIHASADLAYATTMRVDERAVTAGVEALGSGAAVIVDVEMVRAGLVGVDARCYLDEVGDGVPGTTRSAAAMRLGARRHPRGAVVVVGCAPSALAEAVRLIDSAELAPALLVGLPVGFVGAEEAKRRARASAPPTITNTGEKGGSAVAAAAVNALARLARDAAEGR